MRTRFGFPVTTFTRAVLAPRACVLRVDQTQSERMLWSALRNKQLGVRFRRQVVLGRFIVDFFAPSAKLVVEIDGGIHGESNRSDHLRDDFFSHNGLKVVRFEARMVESNLELVLTRIRETLRGAL